MKEMSWQISPLSGLSCVYPVMPVNPGHVPVPNVDMAATVVLAKLVGCMLPIAAKQLHMDPAIMASPLITTIVDAGAVLIYFQAAAALLRLPV